MSLSTLAEIGIKAVALQEAVEQRRAARAVLLDAYRAFRDQHNHGESFDRGTVLYELMLLETLPEYTAMNGATAAERQARDRLERACRKELTGLPPVSRALSKSARMLKAVK